jgi:predicted ATP-grasp superfamily ATP-dependent carboligase
VSFAIAGSACRLFGASRQLVGRVWCNARGYAWSGAVDVPISTLAAGATTRLERLGHVLAGEFGLLGLVGVDLVVDRAGVIHVIEVNPRPTASMELVERTTGESVMATHLAAWGFAAAGPRQPSTRSAAWAKAVVFAERNVVIDAAVDGALAERSARWSADDGWPALADLPAPGTTIDAGRPALTVFAAAWHATGALRRLKHRAAAIRAILRSAPVSRPSAGAWRQPHPPRGSTA